LSGSFWKEQLASRPLLLSEEAGSGSKAQEEKDGRVSNIQASHLVHILNMVFGEDEGKNCEAGYDQEINITTPPIPTCFLRDNKDEGKNCEVGYDQEINITTSPIPSCFLRDNGNDDGAKCSEKEGNSLVVRLRSRRKAGEISSEKRRHKKSTKSPLEFTYKKLSLYFMLPLPIAARALDISHTSLKKLCRELGIVRWPYVRGGLHRFGHRLAAVQEEGNAHETLATSSMTNAGSAESGASEVWNLARVAFSSFDSTPATPASAASTPASTPSRTSTALVRVHRGPSIMHGSLEPPRLELDTSSELSCHVANDLSTDDLSWLFRNTTSHLREGDSALDLELVLRSHEEVLKSYT
jgi:hypothetical protein